MKWSWKIARVAGIDVNVHATFLILIAWIALGYWQLEGTITAVVSGVTFIFALFFCVLLHELGHALTALHYGIRTRNIILLPIGGVAQIEKTPERPREEMVIALAGPAVSMAIGVLLWAVLSATGSLAPIEEMGISGGSFMQRLMMVNFLLGAFNMLPAFPMDGGRVFRAGLAMRMDPVKATRIAAGVAQVIAFGLAFIGLRYNLFLVFIAIFIWFGASTESSMAAMRSFLGNRKIGDAMLHEFHVLERDDSLGKAVDMTIAGAQKDFPVVAEGQVIGVLRQADLIRGLHDHGKLCRVDQVMHDNVPQAGIGDPLEGVIERIQASGAGLLVVVDRGRLAGIIDLDNVLELLKINQAIDEHRHAVFR